jgi:hypothetical protein
MQLKLVNFVNAQSTNSRMCLEISSMQNSLTHTEIRQRPHDKILVRLFERKDMLSSFLTHTLFKKQAACMFLSRSELWLICQIFFQEQIICFVLQG